MGWMRLWNRALNYGVQHIKGLQVFNRLMSSMVATGKLPCPHCNPTSLDSSVLDHFLNVHDQQWNMEDLFKNDVSRVVKFRKLFKAFA